jgi:hypothetical protein
MMVRFTVLFVVHGLPSFMQADLDNAQPQPTPRHPLPAAHGSI